MKLVHFDGLRLGVLPGEGKRGGVDPHPPPALAGGGAPGRRPGRGRPRD